MRLVHSYDELVPYQGIGMRSFNLLACLLLPALGESVGGGVVVVCVVLVVLLLVSAVGFCCCSYVGCSVFA